MKRKPSVATVIAGLALFVSLGGTAAAHFHHHRKHANTNPTYLALIRASAHWKQVACAGHVRVLVGTTAPAELGGVSAQGCMITINAQDWQTTLGIDRTFPLFCELVAYGYGELLGDVNGAVLMTPECAKHATLWWNDHHNYTWAYRGTSYVSMQYYPTHLPGI